MSEPVPINPYAVPATWLVSQALADLARIEGNHLVVPKDWQSPPVCLLTGETNPLTPVRRAKLSWSNPMFIFLIGAERGTFHYYLSAAQASHARKRLLGNWGIFGASLLSFTGAFSDGSVGLAWLGVTLLLLCLIFATTVCRLIKVAKMDKTTIWLRGIPRLVLELIVRMDQEQHLLPPGMPGRSALRAALPPG